jgi:filamentous hemagglutinin family protein
MVNLRTNSMQWITIKTLAFFSAGILGCNLLKSLPVLSQVVPDETLREERSRVVVNPSSAIPGELIEGGAIRGNNLFHSFTVFNIGAGRSVYVSNPSIAVQTILMRVTGSRRSTIAGTLGVTNAPNVTGSPNLFLINPNGIVFGPDARLDVAGAFVATTANAIRLGDTGLFSATRPNASNLLTIKPSALLFNRLVSQPIIHQAHHIDANGESLGLRVPDGASLIFMGGTVMLNGGVAQATDGRVQIGGLAGAGAIALSGAGHQIRATLPQDNRANVTLTNRAAINVAGTLGGTIAIAANHVQILQNSDLAAGFVPFEGIPSHQAGDIRINATGDITLDRSRIANAVEIRSSGNAGNVFITGRSLTLSNGAQIISNTFGQGDAGNVWIRADDVISLSGQSTGILSSIGGSIDETSYLLGRGGVGDGGDITLQSRSLRVQDGAQIQTIVFRESDGIPGGRGDAGNIRITATDTVTLAGYSANGFSSGLLTSTERNAIGSAGNITVNTGTLHILEGATINTITSNASDSGDITINADNLTLEQGGQVLALSRASGRAGDIRIQVGDRLTLSGRDANFETRLDQAVLAGDIPDIVNNQGARSGLFAITASGNGGNVTVRVGNLLLQGGSQISATAGTAQQSGNGGNISIDARAGFVIARPQQNNDITANAFTGSGGRVQISAQSILGLTPLSRDDLQTRLGTNQPAELDPVRLPSSDVSAISQSAPNLDGQVIFNTPDIGPAQDLVELPANLLDASQQIAQNCPTGGATTSELGEFVITGRGGLPPSPDEVSGGEETQVEWFTPKAEENSPVTELPPAIEPVPQIVEASGWITDPNGEVKLIAYHPDTPSPVLTVPSGGCP